MMCLYYDFFFKFSTWSCGRSAFTFITAIAAPPATLFSRLINGHYYFFNYTFS